MHVKQDWNYEGLAQIVLHNKSDGVAASDSVQPDHSAVECVFQFIVFICFSFSPCTHILYSFGPLYDYDEDDYFTTQTFIIFGVNLCISDCAFIPVLVLMNPLSRIDNLILAKDACWLFQILFNPFDDIIPRQLKRGKKDKEDEKKIKSKSRATKSVH